MASIKIYSKEQVDTLMSSKADMTDLPSADDLVPDTTGTSVGDVLTIDANHTPVWQAAGGGDSGVTAHTYATFGEFATDLIAHPLSIVKINKDWLPNIATYSDSITLNLFKIQGSATTTIQFSRAFISIAPNNQNTSITLDVYSFVYNNSSKAWTVSTGSTTLSISDIALYY